MGIGMKPVGSTEFSTTQKLKKSHKIGTFFGVEPQKPVKTVKNLWKPNKSS
jgi:hypothetical protein